MTKENPFPPFLQCVLLVACWHQFFCSLSITNGSRLPLPLCFPVLSLALFPQEALQYGQHCREKDKCIMPPGRSFATTLSYELPKHGDREAMAGRQVKQSIASLHAINNHLGFASSRFPCCADPNHYFSPTEGSLVKVLKDKTEIWWKPVRIQDNCSPGTGETAKTDQVRTVFHQWCTREEQTASSEPLYNWSAVSFPQQLKSLPAVQMWPQLAHAQALEAWTHIHMQLTTKAGAASAPAWPRSLHLCYPASSSVILSPLGTFTHSLQPTEPCSPFHSCLLLLSKGHTSVATVPQLHELSSALHPPWGLVLLAESTVTLTIIECFLTWEAFLVYHFSFYLFFWNNVPIKHAHKCFIKLPSTDNNIYWLLWLWPISIRMPKWWKKGMSEIQRAGAEKYMKTFSARENGMIGVRQ